MRLKEPMQGIKLVAQGHAITHIAFFITMFFVDKVQTVNPPKPESEYTEWELYEKNVFIVLQWGHLICALNQLFFMRTLKQKGMFNHAEILNAIISNALYMSPVLLSLYFRQNRDSEAHDVPLGK